LQVRRWLVWALAATAAAGGTAFAAESPKALVVFAAASLTDALQQISDDYTRATGAVVRLSFAGSSVLARQIESGADADVFLSADQQWMDYLDERGCIRQGTRRDLLANRLVLVAPANSAVQLHIGPHFPLRAALQGGRLATGDPDSVPVGRYAKAALTSLGVWNDVADRLVGAENVRSALAFVARGEVPLGIVYETDARVDKKVRVVDVFPATSHPPIAYPVALTRTAAAGSTEYLAYLSGTAARATFEKLGFTVLAAGRE
jgi:molybdate transport system substrate-binding protein